MDRASGSWQPTRQAAAVLVPHAQRGGWGLPGRLTPRAPLALLLGLPLHPGGMKDAPGRAGGP